MEMKGEIHIMDETVRPYGQRLTIVGSHKHGHFGANCCDKH